MTALGWGRCCCRAVMRLHGQAGWRGDSAVSQGCSGGSWWQPLYPPIDPGLGDRTRAVTVLSAAFKFSALNSAASLGEALLSLSLQLPDVTPRPLPGGWAVLRGTRAQPTLRGSRAPREFSSSLLSRQEATLVPRRGGAAFRRLSRRPAPPPREEAGSWVTRSGSCAGSGLRARFLTLRPSRTARCEASWLLWERGAEASPRKCGARLSANGDDQSRRAALPDWDAKFREISRGAARQLAPMALP